MAALRRRTVFAAPLIISLASGCKDDGPTTTSNPPGPVDPPPIRAATFVHQWDVRRAGPGLCHAHDLLGGPKRESECPPGTSGKTVIRVGEVAPDRCFVVPANCDQPRCVSVAAPCPLPEGKTLPARFVEVWVVEKNKNGDGGCHAEEPEGTCPPGVDCNPPTPRKVACPPGVTDTEEKRVALLEDKTCAIAPEGCNSPSCVGDKTPCP